MLTAAEALSAILDRVPPLGSVTVSVRRAEGLRLAHDVVAPFDVPPFDNAGMDGYAVRSSDTAPAPVVLAISGETAAGDPPGHPLPPGAARAIMTGAPVPPGADAVVQFELTERASDREVRVPKPVAPGANIRRRGSDVTVGSVPLGTGRLVRPFEQGVLASLGVQFVEVRRAPSVLLVPTGNELTAAGYSPGPGMIRESITPVVAALLRAEGCDVRIAPIEPDDPARIAAAVVPPPGVDLVVTTGGVSAGRHDELPRALAAAGFDTVFHGVNIRPGKPLLFGMRGPVPVFALPGNPVSAAVTFIQFVRPAIRKMSGDPEPARKRTLHARLAVAVGKADGKRHYLRGLVGTADGQPTVRPAGAQQSNAASVLAAANCLIVLPEEGREFPASSIVEVELL
jgi:molybdopterin molybdotransferase